MPGPNAYKPDDIVKGLSGKTIEVINTDAEGRVILSDAIEYANRLKVDQMIDLATLTGACMIALGNYTAGLFSNDNKLTETLLRSSKEAGEKLWELPLDEELRTEGYDISRIINYTVEHIDEFQNNVIEELKKNIPDIVYVYSENSAKSLLNIIKKYQLIDSWMNTNLMCIGEKTSSVLNDVKWKKIFLFSPGEEEFLLYKI